MKSVPIYATIYAIVWQQWASGGTPFQKYKKGSIMGIYDDFTDALKAVQKAYRKLGLLGCQ